MVVSFFTAYAFGMFFWYYVPVNSPNNYFLSQDPQIEGYQPNDRVLDFEKAMRESQKEVTPISTFPSAHVMWGMQLVYFWARYNKKTLFIFAPWFLLMTLGTVFLAQHYAVDVLLAFPLGILSIWIGRSFADRSVKAVSA
jgi:membrane-associated phospholipid phosphatase